MLAKAANNNAILTAVEIPSDDQQSLPVSQPDSTLVPQATVKSEPMSESESDSDEDFAQASASEASSDVDSDEAEPWPTSTASPACNVMHGSGPGLSHVAGTADQSDAMVRLPVHPQAACTYMRAVYCQDNHIGTG